MSIFSKFESLEYLKINGNPLSDTGLKINDNQKFKFKQHQCILCRGG